MKLEELQKLDEMGEIQGLYEDIEDDVYHHPDAPGKSSTFFKTLIQETPLHAITKLKEHADSDAMMFGRAQHLAVQDYDQFLSKYIVAPEGMIRNVKHTKYQEFLAANGGKQVLTSDQWEMLHNIKKSFSAHPLTKLMKGALIEHSAFWVDDETGVTCKVRPDFFVDGVVYDLKTSANGIDPFTFEKTIHTFGYHVSAAMYLEGLSEVLGEKLKRFVLIAAEKKPPYEIVFYDVIDAVIEKGQEEFRRSIKTYAECVKKGEFPGYDKTFHPAGLPSYAY